MQFWSARQRHRDTPLDDLGAGEYVLHDRGWGYCDPYGCRGWVPDEAGIERHPNGAISVDMPLRAYCSDVWFWLQHDTWTEASECDD